VCHLRFGTGALLRMTRDTLAGRATSYYPGGRSAQRPQTVRPAPGERPEDVLVDWRARASGLDDLWSTVDGDDWATTVREPVDDPDLGPVPLARLALARLTEVDVHGVDLDIDFADWSPTRVDVALPTRLAWLATRRANDREIDRSVQSTWLLVADDLRWAVSVDGDRVRSAPVGAGPVTARATIAGTRRDLLALPLGRPPVRPVDVDGDLAFAAAFERAFPGP
jgi:hypothetical protein